MKPNIESYLGRLRTALDQMPTDDLVTLSEALYRAYRDGKQVFTLGNGGSASTASHMAADLAKNTIGPNMRRFRIMSLNDNMALVSALANDIGYDEIFREQLVNLIQPGDLLIVITGSGNSPNVLRAMEYARERSALVSGLLGFDGGKALKLCDIPVLIPSKDYGVVEDLHVIVNHMLVEYFRERLAGEQPSAL